MTITRNSARKINCQKLCDLLAARKWKEADQETANCMVKVAKREKKSYLEVEDKLILI